MAYICNCPSCINHVFTFSLGVTSRCCQYITSLSHYSQSTPSGQALAPFCAYLFYKCALSPFINRLTQSLKPAALNSPPKYSNFPSNYKQSLAMSTRSCSVTLTITMFKIQGASNLIAPSHASFPSHAPSILPCLVTCTLWGGKPFSFRSVASNFIAHFEAHCCIQISAKTLS